MNIKMIDLPVGQDPDAVIRDDINNWKRLVSAPDNFMDWLFAKIEKESDLNSAEGKKKLARAILPWLKRLPDIIEQTHYLQILAGKVKVGEEILRRYLGGQSVRRRVEARPGKNSDSPAKKDIWREVSLRFLALLAVLGKDREPAFDFSEEWLMGDEIHELYKNLNLFYDKDVNFSDETSPLVRELILTAQELKASLTKEEIIKEANLAKARLRFNFLRTALRLAKEKIKAAESSGDKAELDKSLARWQELQVELLHYG